MNNKICNVTLLNARSYVILTVSSVFVIELLLMIWLQEEGLSKGILEATLLSLSIIPVLYLFLYKPLVKNVIKSKLVEERLIDLTRTLEQQVLDRTNELLQVNRLLETEYTEALRLSEENYKIILDNLEVGVSVINPDMRIISVNKHMLKWRPHVDFSQKPLCYKVNVSEAVQGVCRNCPVQTAFKEGKISCLTVERVINGNLRNHRIIASPLKNADGKIIAVTELIEDVTEQKMLQENLEQAVKERTQDLSNAEARYRSLMLNSSEGIYVFDPGSLIIQEANNQFLTLLGFTQKEIVGLNVMKFIMADQNNIMELIQQMIGENKPVKLVSQYKKKDHSLIYVEVSSSIIQYGDSKVCLVNVHDITERKKGEEAIQQNVLELRKTLYAGIDALIYIVEKRDPYTAGHQQRVAALAQAIAQEMSLEKSEIETIRIAGVLHDIGKIYVPSDILNKPGRLTDMEMGIIKTHPQVSFEIIEQMPFKTNVAEIVLQHHERLDGSGYPKGLKGKNISIGAKILGVADVVEAMSSHRPYRPAIGWQLALKEIEDKKGILYDAEVVEACLRVYDSELGSVKAEHQSETSKTKALSDLSRSWPKYSADTFCGNVY